MVMFGFFARGVRTNLLQPVAVAPAAGFAFRPPPWEADYPRRRLATYRQPAMQVHSSLPSRSSIVRLRPRAPDRGRATPAFLATVELGGAEQCIASQDP